MKNYINIKNVKIGEGLPKICVPLIIQNDEEILEKIEELKLVKLDLIELRIDYYEKVNCLSSVKNLLKILNENFKNIPIIFTFRTKDEGGEKNISLDYYEKLNIEVIKTGYIDLIDLQFFIKKNIINNITLQANKYNVKIILSNHNFNFTPKKDELIKILCNMEKLKPHLLKIAVMPKTKKDILNLMYVANEINVNYNIPIIAVSMGDLGFITRVIGGMFGSCITFGVAKKSSAPGQIDANKLYNLIDSLYNIK
nr:type I 3-dehydroquinate dehydratase [uncultured Tyzzerella sp.]